MIKSAVLIDLYLVAVTNKLFTWDHLLRFAKAEPKFKSLLEVEVCEVYSEISKHYINV